MAQHSLPVHCKPEEFRWWTEFFQASVERARQWSHSSDCYAKEAPQLAYWLDSILCSCGEGKVSAEFKANTQWSKYAPFVTRLAMSPIFPVPYINPVGAILDDYFPDKNRDNTLTAAGVSGKCLLCKTTPEKLKKCGRCRVAEYCSRECQTKDWPRHKNECHS